MEASQKQDAAFRAAIIEKPDDDTARLIYADWLEEHDRADRAQFIRAQCELAKLPASDPRRPALEDSADDLLALHQEEWVGDPPSCLERWTFRRGFVDVLELAGTASLGSGEGVFACHPVRCVTLDAVGNELTTLTESPLLERLAALELSAPLDDHVESEEGLEELLTTPRLAGLQELRMWGDLGGENCLPLLIERNGAGCPCRLASVISAWSGSWNRTALSSPCLASNACRTSGTWNSHYPAPSHSQPRRSRHWEN